MSELPELETRCVVPFYLKMMGLNALQQPVDYRSLAAVARRTSDIEVARLLRGGWRPRVMGAWFSAGRRDPLVEETLLWSLTTSAGSLTAPPLAAAAAAIVNVGVRAIGALQEYLQNDLTHDYGSAGFVSAALERLGQPAAGMAVAERDRSALAGMVAVAARLAGNDPPSDGTPDPGTPGSTSACTPAREPQSAPMGGSLSGASDRKAIMTRRHDPDARSPAEQTTSGDDTTPPASCTGLLAEGDVRAGADDADPLRPVWLLDVDGVLNAAKPGWGAAPVTRTVYADAAAFQMRFAPALLRRLRRLHDSGAVEVRWATTWVDHIDQVTGLMNLPPWPCAFTLAGTGRDAVAAKYAAAWDVVLTERRRLIWTDDEAIPADGTYAHRRLTTAGPSVLLIRPLTNRGLQPEHLDRIEAFLGRG